MLTNFSFVSSENIFFYLLSLLHLKKDLFFFIMLFFRPHFPFCFLTLESFTLTQLSFFFDLSFSLFSIFTSFFLSFFLSFFFFFLSFTDDFHYFFLSLSDFSFSQFSPFSFFLSFFLSFFPFYALSFLSFEDSSFLSVFIHLFTHGLISRIFSLWDFFIHIAFFRH